MFETKQLATNRQDIIIYKIIIFLIVFKFDSINIKEMQYLLLS